MTITQESLIQENQILGISTMEIMEVTRNLIRETKTTQETNSKIRSVDRSNHPLQQQRNLLPQQQSQFLEQTSWKFRISKERKQRLGGRKTPRQQVTRFNILWRRTSNLEWKQLISKKIKQYQQRLKSWKRKRLTM